MPRTILIMAFTGWLRSQIVLVDLFRAAVPEFGIFLFQQPVGAGLIKTQQGFFQADLRIPSYGGTDFGSLVRKKQIYIILRYFREHDTSSFPE